MDVDVRRSCLGCSLRFRRLATRTVTALTYMLSQFTSVINPYPTAFPYGNGMVLHFYQQQESSTTKTVHKVISKGLKTYVYSSHTGENFH